MTQASGGTTCEADPAGRPAGGPAAPRPRLAGLDVLRFVALALVLGRHMPPPPDDIPWAPRAALSAWLRGGWVGVDLFFVLSGFLVAGLLFADYKATGRVRVGRFYLRRGWKIYPAFYVLLAVTVVVASALRLPFEWRAVFAEAVFLQNYLGPYWGHTWSLAVEEHFYLLLPLLLLAVRRAGRDPRNPFRPLPGIAAAVLMVCAGLRVATAVWRPAYDHMTHLFPTHLRLDSLFVGVALAYAYHFHPRAFADRLTPYCRPLLLGGGLLLVPAFVLPLETTPLVPTVGLTLFALGSALLVAGAVVGGEPRAGWVRVVARVGGYSYSIYLWHMMVVAGMPRLFGPHARLSLGYWEQLAVYLLGSLVLGVLMAHLVELPLLRVRDRWFPARPATVTPDGQRPSR